MATSVVKHKRTARKRAAAPMNPTSTSYDSLKEFKGQKYTGMKVGRSHKWKYEAGDWTEKKVTPDDWEFRYAVTKRRAGKAPEGSGVPVGTAYHWYILADQTVTKLDANSYTTEMIGMKYKLSHKRADKNSWSSSERAQRKRLIQLLKHVLSDLEKAASSESDASAAPSNAPKNANKKQK